jgi:hypothetical protein
MSAVLNRNICFIGGGNMAQALIGGLISRGLPSTRITVSDPVEQVRHLLAEKDLVVSEDNASAIREADVVVLAVKPQVLADVLKPLNGLFDGKLIISIVAGAEIATIAALAGTNRIVRVMPNTPALVQTGAHGLYATEAVDKEDRDLGLNLKPKHSRNWPNLAPTHRPKSFRHLASNNWCVPKLAAFSESVVLKLATIQLGTMPDHNWYQSWFGLEYFSAASQQPTAQFAVWTKPIEDAKL